MYIVHFMLWLPWHSDSMVLVYNEVHVACWLGRACRCAVVDGCLWSISMKLLINGRMCCIHLQYNLHLHWNMQLLCWLIVHGKITVTGVWCSPFWCYHGGPSTCFSDVQLEDRRGWMFCSDSKLWGMRENAVWTVSSGSDTRRWKFFKFWMWRPLTTSAFTQVLTLCIAFCWHWHGFLCPSTINDRLGYKFLVNFFDWAFHFHFGLYEAN